MINHEEVTELVPHWAKPPTADILVQGFRGSDAHDTKIEGHKYSADDLDVFSVSIQSPEWYMGLDGYTNKSRQVYESVGDIDLLVYDVRKFIYLLEKGNPNVIFWLWMGLDKYMLLTDKFKYLQDNREHFLSMGVINSLLGYAKSQFNKMQKKKFYGYMGEKRKKIVEEVGYDVKHASHCYRLLMTGIHLVNTGEILVELPEEEKEFAKDIKKGEVSFSEVLELIEYFDNMLMGKIEQAELEFPKKPDRLVTNKILTELIQSITAPKKGGL